MSAAPVTGQPGDGCTDPREVHYHWCGFCGARTWFTLDQCRLLRFVPPCTRCGECRWKTEVDELIAPNYREPKSED